MKRRKNRINRIYYTVIIPIIVMTVCIGTVGDPAPDPQVLPAMAQSPDDRVYSRAVMMTDTTDARVCYTRDADIPMPAASLVKIMTALVSVENLPDLDLKYRINAGILDTLRDSRAAMAGFEEGEEVSLRDLLYGLLLPSGADAAVALCDAVCGSMSAFVDMMNSRAEELGMDNSYFSDATGLDDTHSYSTAADMALLFSAALENDTFFEIVTTDRYLTSATEQHKNGILLVSTLNDPMREHDLEDIISGGKTGYTQGAGLCLATFAERDGHRYILVTMGAGKGNKHPEYHFMDAAMLYDRYS